MIEINAYNLSDLAPGGAVGAMAAISAFPENVEVTQSACKALVALASASKVSLSSVLAAGGAEALIMLEKTMFPYVDTRTNYIAAGLHLLSKRSAGRARLIAAGGVDVLALFASMPPRLGYREAMNDARKALRWIACSAEGRASVAAAAGLADAVPESAAEVEACNKLMCIVAGHTLRGTPRNEWSGIAAGVVAALRDFPASRAVAQRACRATCALAQADGRADIVAAGGAAAIVAALGTFPSCTVVAETACSALGDIARGRGERADVEKWHANVDDAGGAAAVVAVLWRFLSHETVVTAACTALCGIASSSAGRLGLLEAGGAEAVKIAALAFPRSAAACDACTAFS